MLFAPVIAGYWRHHETYDGTYTLDDLLDIIEVMQVKQENERRAEFYEKLYADMQKI